MSYKKFTFNKQLTTAQIEFFNTNGFLHFENYISQEFVDEILASSEKVQEEWIAKGITKIKGIPLKFGKDEYDNTIIHRFAFLNQYSEPVQKLLTTPAFEALKVLLPKHKNPRIATNEKDGSVLNHYVNTDNSNYMEMGWHTDGARDIFYGTRVEPMLNVGLYLDDSPVSKGGLRVLPGSHRQSIISLLFKKKYFLDHEADKNEVCIEAKAGDLVIHHGSIWHRVAKSTLSGAASRRRVMYTPMIVGKVVEKNENSTTPFYHHFASIVGKRKKPVKAFVGYLPPFTS